MKSWVFIGSLLFCLLLWSLPLQAASTDECYDDADTTIMWHANGTDGSTTFTNEVSDCTLTATGGDVQIDTAQSQFGGASALFDGTGDFATYSANSCLDLSSNDFTIDFWVRFNSTAANNGLFTLGTNSTTDYFVVWWDTGNTLSVRAQTSDADTHNMTFAWTPSTATWYHVALTRNGSSWRAFVDGTQIGTTQTDSDSVGSHSGTRQIGRATGDEGNIYELNGWLDELRVIIGTAVWTGNFTAPSSAYSSCGRRMMMVG